MVDDIRELTEQDFARAIPRKQRERIMRGQIDPVKDIVALRRFAGLAGARRKLDQGPVHRDAEITYQADMILVDHRDDHHRSRVADHLPGAAGCGRWYFDDRKTGGLQQFVFAHGGFSISGQTGEAPVRGGAELTTDSNC